MWDWLYTLLRVATFSVLLTGCMDTPQNGFTYDGDTTATEFFYHGFVNQSSQAIQIEVLKDARDDPTDNSKWGPLATTFSHASPKYDGVGQGWYDWSISVQSKRAMWPQGGLQRVRIKNLTTFSDGDYSSCVEPKLEAGEGGISAGYECQSPYPFVTMVSTTPNPTDAKLTRIYTPPYLSYGLYSPSARRGFDKGSDLKDTRFYYANIAAPSTFEAFKDKYRFGKSEPEAISIYFNEADLGLGREMHCKNFAAKFQIFFPFGGAPLGVVCYVTNYDGVGKDAPSFPADPALALSDAINGTHQFATVAMAFDPSLGRKNRVQFLVYNGKGTLSNLAQLDSRGINKYPPLNCLVCHGGSVVFDTTTQTYNSVQDAHFLPFDVFRLKYAGDPGMPDNPAYTYSAQAEEFRKLNEYVYDAGATPDIRSMIDATYGGPGNVSVPNTPAQEYVPDSWRAAGKSKVYENVIKGYCRSCHVSREEKTITGKPPLSSDFENYLNFERLVQGLQVYNYVCGGQSMPNAEQTLALFWNSSARAHLAGAFPQEMAGECSPLALR
jgi:hypothetical protein